MQVGGFGLQLNFITLMLSWCPAEVLRYSFYLFKARHVCTPCVCVPCVRAVCCVLRVSVCVDALRCSFSLFKAHVPCVCVLCVCVGTVRMHARCVRACARAQVTPHTIPDTPPPHTHPASIHPRTGAEHLSAVPARVAALLCFPAAVPVRRRLRDVDGVARATDDQGAAPAERRDAQLVELGVRLLHRLPARRAVLRPGCARVC